MENLGSLSSISFICFETISEEGVKMGIADDIKNLGDDIVTSYDMRVKAIGQLVKDTNKMLKGFQSEHKKMASSLKADLAKGEQDRLKAFNSIMSDVKKYVADMVEGTAKLMEGIRKEQEDRNNGTADLLAKFAKDHGVMANELRGSLKEGETARLNDFKTMMSGIQKYVDDVIKETKRLISEIQARQEERNKGVLDLLEAFKTEREKMAANWQSMAATMANRRGIKPEVEAEVKVRPVEEAIEEVEEEVAPEEDEEIEEAVEEVEVPVEDKVLQFINRHPEGVRVSDMEEPLQGTRMRLGQIAKRLLDEGKVRKEGPMYFPL
jgi:hypothetical protein